MELDPKIQEMKEIIDRVIAVADEAVRQLMRQGKPESRAKQMIGTALRDYGTQLWHGGRELSKRKVAQKP